MHRSIRKMGITALAMVAVIAWPHQNQAGAAQKMKVDTIVLEETAAEDVPVDMKWKTRREGGRWVETLPVSEGVDSLLLVINDENGAADSARASSPNGGAKVKKREMACNSRMLFYMRNADGVWEEIFGTTCVLSGGSYISMDELYGIYRADQGFGLLDNPGSLVSYRHLTEKDYLIMDEDSENYGTIVTVGPKGVETDISVKLESMKAYSNYGMVLKPEDQDETYPALVVNCQQADAVEDVVGGIQVGQPYVRQLLQLLDGNARVVIAKNLEELESMN